MPSPGAPLLTTRVCAGVHRCRKFHGVLLRSFTVSLSRSYRSERGLFAFRRWIRFEQRRRTHRRPCVFCACTDTPCVCVCGQLKEGRDRAHAALRGSGDASARDPRHLGCARAQTTPLAPLLVGVPKASRARLRRTGRRRCIDPTISRRSKSARRTGWCGSTATIVSTFATCLWPSTRRAAVPVPFRFVRR